MVPLGCLLPYAGSFLLYCWPPLLQGSARVWVMHVCGLSSRMHYVSCLLGCCGLGLLCYRLGGRVGVGEGGRGIWSCCRPAQKLPGTVWCVLCCCGQSQPPVDGRVQARDVGVARAGYRRDSSSAQGAKACDQGCGGRLSVASVSIPARRASAVCGVLSNTHHCICVVHRASSRLPSFGRWNGCRVIVCMHVRWV